MRNEALVCWSGLFYVLRSAMDHGFEINSAAQERLADFRRQAEDHRLARAAKAQRRQSPRWSSVALIWLGQRLTQWGQRLERRHQVLDVLHDTAM
jgi:acyl-CoA reductase-like NAD-dependent aldehyde dehydrogenase